MGDARSVYRGVYPLPGSCRNSWFAVFILGFTVTCTGQGKDEFDCGYDETMEYEWKAVDKWEQENIREFTCPEPVERLALRCY